jgi:hypothetical protein
MDWTNIGTVAGSFILGIGAVAAFLHKVMPTIRKYLTLANDTIFFLNYLAIAIEDDKLSDSEWDTIRGNAVKLKSSWAAINKA